VSEEEFGLVLRSGSPAALTRPVAGAETVEADRPEELTARDYIMFTTGVRLRGNPELQRQLVVESEARARDFPVFEACRWECSPPIWARRCWRPKSSTSAASSSTRSPPGTTSGARPTT